MQRFADKIAYEKRVIPKPTKSFTVNGKPATVHRDGSIATCDGDTEPSIGCIKVSFFQSTATKLTVVGHVVQTILSAVPGYKPKREVKLQASDQVIRTRNFTSRATSMCPPKEIELFEEGEWEENDMLTKRLRETGDRFRIWAMRLICLVAAVLGMSLFLRSLTGTDVETARSITQCLAAFNFNAEAGPGLEVDLSWSIFIVVTTLLLAAALTWSFAGWLRAIPCAGILLAAVTLCLPNCFRCKKVRDVGEQAKKEG